MDTMRTKIFLEVIRLRVTESAFDKNDIARSLGCTLQEVNEVINYMSFAFHIDIPDLVDNIIHSDVIKFLNKS